MNADDLDEFGTEFPRDIGRVAKRELAANRFTRYEHLTRTTPKELLAIHGIGPKAVRILGEELADRHLSFAGSRVERTRNGRRSLAGPAAGGWRG